ncbi:MAG: hypothetical protein ABJH26_10350, partial [Marinomonas sp.]
ALTRKQKLWALTGAVPFLLSLCLLGFALNSGKVLVLAIAWPALQVFGYVGAINRAKGDFSHPLWISQVSIHWIALTLITILIVAPPS